MKPKKSHYVLLVAIPAVIAGIIVFDNFDFNVAPKQDSNFSVSALNPFQTYNANNDCELYQTLSNVHKWTVFYLSGERLKEKYADEYSKYSHLNSVQQKMLINLVNSGNSPEGIKELAMTIIMTEFSINPKYREELTEYFSTASAQPMNFGVSGKYFETLYFRALIEDPDCIKNIELVWGSQLTEEDIEILKKHYQNQNQPQQVTSKFGTLGDEHEHASILVRIFGDKFDFSLPAYQIKNSWTHFEAQDGTTIHRHSTAVTLGHLFETIGIGLTEDCYNFPDGRTFCTNDDYSLKYYINHEQVSVINDYVIKEGDRILISYGNEDQTQIDSQLSELDSYSILD